MKLILTALAWLTIFPVAVLGAGVPKHILVFSKSAGYEHAIVYRDTAWPCFLEQELMKLGEENNIAFTFSKDGTIFTNEPIAKYDAFFFFTSGDPTDQPRNGKGDNYTLMPPEGKALLLQAIRNGKGFIGIHSAITTFARVGIPREPNQISNPEPYSQMLGAEFIGHGPAQPAHLIQVDPKFPGMESLPSDFAPLEECYASKNFAPDMHVILAANCSQLTGDLYRRPNFPLAWTRMEGKGRVYFNALGHDEKTWKNPAFRHLILGGIQWAAGTVDARVNPNIATATPGANEIPPALANPSQLKP